ncbi:Sulfate transporter CysZ [Mannheimia haemolytica]
MSSVFSEPQNQVGLGFHYFIYGWRLLLQRQFLPFVIFPILINTVLMVGLIWGFLPISVACWICYCQAGWNGLALY